MAEPAALDLLSTKIYRPPLPADCVHRSDLLRLLDEGRSRPLTLVSAPAGYGKSVLVSNWLENSDWASVWVSLDEDDSDPQRFLSYLAAALREHFPDALEVTRSLGRTTQLPDASSVANVVSNELNALGRPFFLVLDDYHRIHTRSPVNEILRHLLDRPPIPLHLVLLTRRDPPLPLGRLRGLGQVSEIRMQDLRFTASETYDLLRSVAHINASDEAVANIESRLEGWAAGLRLLTLTLRGTDYADAFLKSFRGGTQQMQEYLLTEVMSGLPIPLRKWLSRSAVLDRFCAPLCEAVCLAEDESGNGLTGEDFLAQLRNTNLFLVPLDGYGRWFRFHHLFQSLLQADLYRDMDEKAVALLHMKASHWFDENGFVEDALRSAMKAGKQDVAADIFERHRLEKLEQLNWHTIGRWLEVLGPTPPRRPGVQLAEAFVAVRRFDVPRQAAILEEAAPTIENNPAHEDLIGELRCLQGILQYRLGNGEAAHALLQEAHRRFQPSEKQGIAGFGVTHETLSLGLCGRGDEALAQNESLETNAAAGDPIYHSLLLAGRAGLSYLRGDLARSANEGFRQYNVAQAGGAEFPLGLSLFFRIASELQRGEFDAALQLSDDVAQRRYTMPLRMAFGAMTALALSRQFLHQAGAATRAADNLLTLAEEHNDAAGLEAARSCAARILLLQGDLDSAAKWAGVDEEPPTFAGLFLSVEVPAITRARIWIAQGSEESLRRAYRLIHDVGRLALDYHMTSQVIEADVLKSLALAGLAQEKEALACLAETTKLAAPGGWLRPFLEAGSPMAALLAKLDGRGLATDYSRHLHNAVRTWLAGRSARVRPQSGVDVALDGGLRETLTARELDILGLLGDRMQNKEIARELSVSPETVKSHLKSLYSKLGVGSRREAAVLSKAILAAAPDVHEPVTGR